MKLNRIFCLFGKHEQSKKALELKPSEHSLMGMELFFCVRCKKILFIGYLPPVHPNCLSSLFYDIKLNKKSEEFLTQVRYVGKEPKMEVCEIEEEICRNCVYCEPLNEEDGYCSLLRANVFLKDACPQKSFNRR